MTKLIKDTLDITLYHDPGTFEKDLGCSVTTAFLRAMRLRDAQLYIHAVMVGAAAEMVSVALNMEGRRVRLLRVAGLLHDVGKLALPDSILNKNGTLSQREWEQVRLHPQHGATHLQHLPGCDDVVAPILAHHEEEDGSGYPFSIVSSQISFEARILRICDRFCASVEHRPYKPAYPPGMAVNIALEASGLTRNLEQCVRDSLQSFPLEKLHQIYPGPPLCAPAQTRP